MEDQFAQQILERLAQLPESVQKAIRSADLQTGIQDLAKKHRLHLDQTTELEEEIYLVMLGFAPPESFADRLKEHLNLSPEAAVALAADTNVAVFMPIQAQMKAGEAQKAPPAPATPQPPGPKPAELHPADMMLSQKTVSAAPPAVPAAPQPAQNAPQPAPAPKVDPAKPKSYTNDPYREPPL